MFRGAAFLFEDLQHLHELREDEHLLAVGHERVEQFKQRVGLAAGGVAAHERRDGSKSGAGG